jgi:hypothetical protein
VVVKSHRNISQGELLIVLISVFISLLLFDVASGQSLTAKISANFKTLKDLPAQVVGYLVISLHGYIILVKNFLC